MSEYLNVSQVFITSFSEVENEADEFEASTDVIVEMRGGQRYSATFFTQKQIQNKLANEFTTNQPYFWVKNLVVVNNIKQSNVEHVVREMIEEGDFQLVFEKLTA